MARTAINLYSVRSLEEPLPRTLDRVAAAGYDGVQFFGGFGALTVAEAAEELAERDLDAAPAHVGIEDLESAPDDVAESYLTIGADGLVVPHIDEAAFASAEEARETGARLDALADRLPDGIGLHYHNHDHEFVDCDGALAFDVFADASSVGLEIDVGWVHTAGHDPVELLERYGDRVDIVHMKDMADGEFTELGAGAVDIPGCAAAALDNGTSWLVYENDQPADPVASIDRGAEVLQSL